ncbi:MAG: DUF2247 family protein [Lachnospiraceae bacterium]|nr:DUF2247 family protein [Lachnospiraceae bacterium]
MIKIKDLKEVDFIITWRLLYRALLNKQLKVEDVIEYAIEQLEMGNDRIEVCEIVGLCDSDTDYLLNFLYELAKKEKSDDEFEDRKLRAVIIKDRLKIKKDNCIDGLMELTDIWLEFGCPEDSPHIIQGRYNNISPYEYYTEDNYNYLFKKNLDWLKNEIFFLKNNQK